MSTKLFKGVRCVTNEQFADLLNNGSIVVDGETITYDRDFLYVTPEDYTTLVRQHTEQIAQNTSDIETNRNNISVNTADIELLKQNSSGQSSEIVDIKNTISEIIIRDTNQDNRLTNIEENFASKEYVVENGGKIDKIAVNGVDQTILNKRVNLTVPTTTNELTNDSGYITKDVNDLTNYSLTSLVGNKIRLNIDSSTFVMTVSLLNSSDGVLSTGTVDLPLETVVIGARYSDGKLYLTLKDGTELEGIDISTIVSGLVPDTRTVNGKDLKQNITISNTDVGAPSTSEFELLENTVNTNGQQITLIKSTLTDHGNRLTSIENNYTTLNNNVVTLDGTQTITGPKTFTEHIYISNADGTVDRISHLNNNFIIHSGATNSAVLNIDEGLEKIYVFNNELAFKSDIAEAAGTTIYVGGTAVASLSFNSDPQTQINLLSEGLDDNKSELTTDINTKVSKSGDTMTGELTASAGIAFGNNKVRAENAGNTFEIIHIENNVDKNVFNYTHGAIFTLNNSETPVIIQGLDDRPSYVSGSGIMSDLALESDIPTKVSDLTNDNNYDTVANVDNKISSNLNTAKSYTDTKIADLIDSAPETRDTLAELAQAIKDNETVVDALNSAIGTKADKSAVPTALNQLTEDSTHRLVTDTEKTTWNSKLSVETDPTVPEWAKKATKPEYEYSEIKNTPDIPDATKLYNTTGENTDGAMTQKATSDVLNEKVNNTDVNFDAIDFAEIERQKVENNLFDVFYTGTIKANTTDFPLSKNILAKVTCTDSNGGIVVKSKNTGMGIVYEFSDVSGVDYYATLYFTVTNLKPLTQYRINFEQNQNKQDGQFYESNIYGSVTQKLFTTDENGKYSGTYFKVSPRDIGGSDPLIVSNVQLIEAEKYTELKQYSGDIIHKCDLLSAAIVADGAARLNQNDTVIECWIASDGNTWYRKWASGWKECGISTSFASYATHTVQLPITFTNINYTAVMSIQSTADDSVKLGYFEISRTESSITTKGSGSWNKSIYCCGY